MVLLPLAGCTTILPQSQSHTVNPLNSYQEIQQVFDQVIPYKTNLDDLRRLNLDPHVNPNILILNYSDILSRFVPSPSVDTNGLDKGVKECIQAKTACEGYEIKLSRNERKRYGAFLLDFFNFRRKVDVVGWRFDGMVLIRDDVVIYKLTGGEPAIHENEDTANPLGPLQGLF